MKNKIIISVIILIFSILILFFYLPNQYVVPVLVYHRIGEPADGLTVSAETFEKQIKHLKQNNYKIWSLYDYIEYTKNIPARNIPRKSVVITFDDGCKSIADYAYPVILQHKAPITIFVISGFINNISYIGKEKLKELHESGLVIIGSHTVHHMALTDLTAQEVKYQVKTSKSDLESILDTKIDFFCYPFGAFNEDIKNEVKKAGYMLACATKVRGKRADIFSVRRIKITERNKIGPSFRIKLSGYYNFLKRR
ncbi:hypothetical protein B9J78_03590 [bacterium Unc6]|nr:hypothetical protein [bacterium Unc6]